MAAEEGLEMIKEKLQAMANVTCSERGSGKSRFLYACSTQRSVEISWDDGEFWIEFWNVADLESDEPSTKEEKKSIANEVINQVEQWLM